MAYTKEPRCESPSLTRAHPLGHDDQLDGGERPAQVGCPLQYPAQPRGMNLERGKGDQVVLPNTRSQGKAELGVGEGCFTHHGPCAEGSVRSGSFRRTVKWMLRSENNFLARAALQERNCLPL